MSVTAEQQVHGGSTSNDQPVDVFISYAVADEPLARLLRRELRRLQPELNVWCGKGDLGVGDALSQSLDQALADARFVILLWTPQRLASGSARAEAERIITLQKPAANALIGLSGRMPPLPFSALAGFELPSMARLAGRGTGWLPPKPPSYSELDQELRPIMQRISDAPEHRNADSADQLISQLGEVAGPGGTVQFETTLGAIARSDRASVVEVALKAGYDVDQVNRLIAPWRLQLADFSGERPSWGAWRIEGPDSRTAVVKESEPWPWAAGGFILASLFGLGAWILSSTVGDGGAGRAEPIQIVTRLKACEMAPDGSIKGGNCRLSADLPARGDTLQACRVRTDGAIQNAPCRLGSNLSVPERSAGPEALKPCQTAANGAVSGAPCRLLANVAPVVSAPQPRPIPQPDREPRPKPLAACKRAADGGISNAPCRLESPIAARKPERECRIEAGGRIENAPCRLVEPLRPVSATASVPATQTEDKEEWSAQGSGEYADWPLAEIPPVAVPDQLEPCEKKRSLPCRLTIAKTGLWDLSAVGRSFYGTPNAYCHVFRANLDLYASRANPAARGNPNCLYLEDVLDLPEKLASGQYDTSFCPPPGRDEVCFRP